MKTIPLFGCDDVALVDDDLFDELKKFKWHKQTGYAARGQWMPRQKKTASILMHRMILPPGEGQCIDHIDFNKLNNTRANLRLCTWSQNIAHSGPRKNGHSKFKGVCWRPKAKKWYAYLSKNRRQIPIGCFEHELDAAKAFNVAATVHFGEFAYLNPV